MALTLREVCGLTTEEIAHRLSHRAAYSGSTHRPRQGKDPGRADSLSGAGARRPAEPAGTGWTPVLQVVYLVFNEGYSASSGVSLTRHDLSGEAIRLGRLLVELLPEPEAMGLLALMLLHEARRSARTSARGRLSAPGRSDRSLWNREQIAEGASLVERALTSRRFGPYTLQAAIGAVHAEAATATRHGLGADRRAVRCADED